MSEKNTTHFGYQEVAVEDKESLVGEVFHSVASKYDVMNDVMSLGQHRIWKYFAVKHSGLRAGDKALDVAAGSGDLTQKFLQQVGPNGHVVMTDINESMLAEGKQRMINAGHVGNISYQIENAEELSFADNQFNCVSISFGLRNVTHIDKALSSMYRVLKPSGRLLILEFSTPKYAFLQNIYDKYSFHLIPKMGELIANDKDSYQYLVESIRKHPDQDTLKGMMTDAGFDEVKVHNMHGGIVALHIGYKY